MSIEQLAKKKHTKVILAGVIAAMGLGMALNVPTITLASNNAFNEVAIKKPSPKLAQKTDLGEDLVGHKFVSNQFTSLLDHKFQMSDDSDITYNTNSDIRPSRKFKLSKGIVKVLAKEPGTSAKYSDVSDSSDTNNDEPSSPIVTYYVTKHNLVLRELFMGDSGDSDDPTTSSALRLVKYHLHSVAKNGNGSKEFIFYPIEYQNKYGSITTIPKKQRSDYPLRLLVANHNQRLSSSLLPN